MPKVIYNFFQSLSTNKLQRIFQSVGLAFAFILLLRLSNEVLRWMAYSFQDPREDMSHGWFVPLFSVAIIFLKRKEIRQSLGRPSWAGLSLALPGLVLFWIGARGDQVRIQQVAAFWILWTLTYASFGKKFARAMIFPTAFLCFAIPFGFLDAFTVKLRALTSFLAAGLLNGLGLPVERIGTGLHCTSGEGFNLDVADPCSGLRSIFALSAITAAYAYLSQKTLLKKWLLFACALPIAVIANIARIFSIALVAKFCGQDTATGFYHDYSGLVVFVIGIAVITQAGNWMAKFKVKTKKTSAPDCAAEPVHAADTPSAIRSSRNLVIILLPCLIYSLTGIIRRMPVPIEEPADFIAGQMPQLDGFTSKFPWYCQDVQCGNILETADSSTPPQNCPRCKGTSMKDVSYGEATVLPKDTEFKKCNYYGPYGEVFRVTIVINGKSRQSIHRPEICMPAQGFKMENRTVHTFNLSDGQKLEMSCSDLVRLNSSASLGFGMGYFFASPRHRTASHWKRQLISVYERAFMNRITRWAMINISGNVSFVNAAERNDDVEEFLSQLCTRLFMPAAKEEAERRLK